MFCLKMSCSRYTHHGKLKLTGYAAFLAFFVITTIVSIYGLAKSANAHSTSLCTVDRILYTYNQSSMAVCVFDSDHHNCFFTEESIGNQSNILNKTLHCWKTGRGGDYSVSKNIPADKYVELTLFSVLTTFMLLKVIALSLLIWKKSKDYREYDEL